MKVTIAQYIIAVVIGNGLIITLFFKVSRLKVSLGMVLKAFILRVPLAVMLATLDQFMPNNLFDYLDEPLYGLILSFTFLRPNPKRLLIFYGLFPVALWNLFYRSVSYFVLSPLNYSSALGPYDFIYLLNGIVSFILVMLFLKWQGYDFEKLRTNITELANERILYLSNWAMFAYYTIMQILTYLDYEKSIDTTAYRRLILILYLIIFMGIIKQLDTHIRNKLQEKLALQQTLQLRDMENYSNHIEELYREVRGFRHDYANLLTTLRLGIEDDDMEQIKEIYQSVLKDSHKSLRDNKYDIGRLINIENSALKSLLTAKFMKASENNVAVSMEVPEVISPQGMELVDFITIVSILCDNAVEAAIDSSTPKINIAFLTVEQKQMFIIENSMKEESIDTSEIYSFGYSSKGSDRGIGLYNVMKIIEHYPNIALNTTCLHHTFCQVLEIGIEK